MRGKSDRLLLFYWKQKGEKVSFKGTWEDKHRIMFRFYFKKLTADNNNKHPAYEKVMKQFPTMEYPNICGYRRHSTLT